jgi:hypothetical protein
MIRKKMRSQRRLLSMKISQRKLKLQLNQLLKFKKLPLNNQRESQSQLNFLRNKLRLKSKRKINQLIRIGDERREMLEQHLDNLKNKCADIWTKCLQKPQLW